MIKEHKNEGSNRLEGKYSSETADFMSKDEIITAVSETDKSLEKSLLDSRIY